MVFNGSTEDRNIITGINQPPRGRNLLSGVDQEPRGRNLIAELDQQQSADVVGIQQPTGRNLIAELDQAEPEQEFLQPQSLKSVLSQAVSNTPKSAERFVKDLISPFLSPVETAKALSGLAQGLGQKLIPGTQENEQIVDSLVDAFKERYGGIENIKRTLAEDPVGFVADISSVFIPGGAAVKTAGIVTKTKTVSKIGKAVSAVGEVLEPTTAARKITKAVARKIIPEDLPSNLFQSAAKFSTTIPEATRAKLAQTALDNRILPTLKGLDKARNKINEFNSKITELIDTATSQGSKIPVNRLFSEFGQLRKQMSGEPITRGRQISRVAKEIHAFHKKKGKKALSIKEAQELKQAIYRETEGYYNSLRNSPARIEAKQAVAKAAKESIEDLFPEIKQLNRNEGSLIQLRKELEKVSSRISNRDLLGIGVPIKGGAGGAVAGVPGLVSGLAVGLFDTPQVKAKLAVVLNSLQKKGAVLADDSLLKTILEAAPGTPAITARQVGKIKELEEE